MRQYRASKNSPEREAQHNKYKKNYRASKASVEQKAKHSEYKKNYRASKASADQNVKNSAYMKIYRQKSNKNIQFHICKVLCTFVAVALSYGINIAYLKLIDLVQL